MIFQRWKYWWRQHHQLFYDFSNDHSSNPFTTMTLLHIRHLMCHHQSPFNFSKTSKFNSPAIRLTVSSSSPLSLVIRLNSILTQKTTIRIDWTNLFLSCDQKKRNPFNPPQLHGNEAKNCEWCRVEILFFHRPKSYQFPRVRPKSPDLVARYP